MSLAVSAGVCWCLLVSVGVLCCLEMSRGVPLGVSGGIWVVFKQIWGARMCLGVIWVSSPFWIEQIALFWHSHEVQEWVTWLYWDIKISKCPDISFPKITGLCHLFDLLDPSEANYKTQSLGSLCIITIVNVGEFNFFTSYMSQPKFQLELGWL